MSYLHIQKIDIGAGSKEKIFEGGTVRPEHDSVVELQKGINRFFDREPSYNYVYVKAADILTGVNKTIILD